jgi:putative tricarboxylic transport membrane protein
VIRAERAGAALGVVLGAGYLWGALAIPEISIGDPLGPRAFPLLLGGLMALLAASLLVWPAGGQVGGMGVSLHTVGLVLLLGLYGYGIPRLGYPLATFLFLGIGSRLLGERSLWVGPVVSACLSAAIFLLFTRVLDIPLPLGVLAGLQG